MIRFIDLKDQIIEDYPAFAWYDTVTDTFENFNGSESWETWSKFQNDYLAHDEYIPESHPLGRYKRLFPKGWKSG